MNLRLSLAAVGILASSFSFCQIFHPGGGTGFRGVPNPVGGSEPYSPDRILVKFNSYSGIRGVFGEVGLSSSVISYNSNINWYCFRLPSWLTVSEAIQKLRSTPGVEACQPDYIRKAQFTPTDPDWPQQYGPVLMGMQNAWNFTLGLQSEVIAVVDTGVQLTHPEFSGRLDVISGANILSPGNTPNDDNGHGTHVAGIIGAGVDNGIGIAGLCPNSEIMPVKVLDSSGNGYDSDISSGITFAVNNGANVINLSLGGTTYSPEEQDAINYANSKGVMCVAACGNDGALEIFYPANDLGVVSVGASTQNDRLASYSNYGPWVTVVAPGDQILSTYTGSSYAYLSGTSMSCAQVSGVLGILQSYAPSGTPISTLENALVQGCQSIGSETGAGRVNAFNSIVALQNDGSSSVSVTPYAVNTSLGNFLYGDVGSLTAIDGNTFSIQSAQMPNLDQQATAWVNFALTQTTSNIKSLSATLCCFGFQNAENRLYAFDYIHRHYVLIGNWVMSQTSNQGFTVQFPKNFQNFIWNGQVSLAVNGDIPYLSYPGTPPVFNFSIDFAEINLTQ